MILSTKKLTISLGIAVMVSTVLLPGSFVYAATTTEIGVCMQKAVTTRDNRMVEAVRAYSGAEIAIFTKRQSAQVSVWTMVDANARNRALKQSYKEAEQSLKQARSNFRDARKSAWAGFTRDRKACGASASAFDIAASVVDLQ
jgi:hypothetical protein